MAGLTHVDELIERTLLKTPPPPLTEAEEAAERTRLRQALQEARAFHDQARAAVLRLHPRAFIIEARALFDEVGVEGVQATGAQRRQLQEALRLAEQEERETRAAYRQFQHECDARAAQRREEHAQQRRKAKQAQRQAEQEARKAELRRVVAQSPSLVDQVRARFTFR